MAKRMSILLSVFVLVALLVTPASAGMSGPGVSGIQIQNLDSGASASVTIDLYNQTDGSKVPLTGTTPVSINPSSAQNFYMPNFANVPGGAYAMVVNSTTNIAAIARTDWSSTGGAAIYNSVAPAQNIIIPLILKNFAGQISQFTIQNTDTSAAATDVSISLFGRGQSTPIKTLPVQTIPGGGSKTWSLGDAIWGTLPDNSTDMGSGGFVGSIRISSSKNLVAQSFIDLPGTRGVTAFSGVDTATASGTLYCPLIRANYFGDTGISIVNPGNSDITAAITYRADAQSPKQGTFTENVTVKANSSAIAFQGPGGSSRNAPTNLPGGTQTGANPTPTNDGFYGVATINVSGGSALAVVNDTKFGAGWVVQSQSSYNCSTNADAGTKFALPLVRNRHLSSTQLTTGIQIQNISGSPVTVSLDLINWNGTPQSSSNPPSITIPANGSGNFWNGNLTGLPTVPPDAGGFGWYGSAILTATGGNVVVVVSDEGFGSTAVDSANYNGLKIQ